MTHKSENKFSIYTKSLSIILSLFLLAVSLPLSALAMEEPEEEAYYRMTSEASVYSTLVSIGFALLLADLYINY